MFWKQRTKNKKPDIDPEYASDIVSQVGGIFASLNDRHQLIKPRTALPCSWFAVRECFMVAYDADYLHLPDELKNAYDQVYGELAFFVEDELCAEFNISLDVVAKCRSQAFKNIGAKEDVASERRRLASELVKYKDRKAIFESLANVEACPRRDLLLVAETLAHCGELYRAMSAEWTAFASLISFRKK